MLTFTFVELCFFCASGCQGRQVIKAIAKEYAPSGRHPDCCCIHLGTCSQPKKFGILLSCVFTFGAHQWGSFFFFKAMSTLQQKVLTKILPI